MLCIETRPDAQVNPARQSLSLEQTGRHTPDPPDERIAQPAPAMQGKRPGRQSAVHVPPAIEVSQSAPTPELEQSSIV